MNRQMQIERAQAMLESGSFDGRGYSLSHADVQQLFAHA
jgi:hypothetical protein